MIYNSFEKLGQLLMKDRVVIRDQVIEALEDQKTSRRKLGEILIDKGWIDERSLSKTLAKQYHLPYVDLSTVQVEEKALRSISVDLMEIYKVLPISIKGQCLTLATNNPLDVAALQDVQVKSGYSINSVMTSITDIENYLADHLDSVYANELGGQKEAFQGKEDSVVELVDSLIRRAIREKASDIHLEPQSEQMRVRFRVDGMLIEKPSISQKLIRNIISRIKILSCMDVAENRKPQDGRFSFNFNANDFDIRISTLPNLYGEDLSLRILSKQFASQNFDSLGMIESEQALMRELLSMPYGLILVTGPTGAGKTTTLYSALNRLNKISRNIISIEDPVEYELSGINQTSINPFIGYTFASAMRHILRHDPDVIMVGEIRDVETAEMAIRAALTGHLVLSTMHTNNAAGAITRLLEMNIEPFLVSSAVIGVIAQRLVRVLCSLCKKEYVPTPEILQSVLGSTSFKDKALWAQPIGCPECLHSGYQGRVGVFEILKVTPEIRAMILKSDSEQNLICAATANGMKTLRKAGVMKVMNRQTTIDEVIRVSFSD